MIVLAFIPFKAVGLILGITLAGFAHRIYVQSAVQKLVRLHAAHAAVTPAMVQAEGGVSKPAGVISGVIYCVLWLIGVFSIIYLASHGIDPTR